MLRQTKDRRVRRAHRKDREPDSLVRAAHPTGNSYQGNQPPRPSHKPAAAMLSRVTGTPLRA